MPWIPNALIALSAAGFALVIALLVSVEMHGALSSLGGWYLALGRFSGLTGTYLMMIQLILIARLPWLERTVGQDRLVRWHRTVAPYPLVLIAIHVVTITIGYAKLMSVGILHEVWTFIAHYPDILASMVAFVLLMTAGLTSAQIVRRRLKYETWWVVHLYIYVALGLAFAHQIVTGVMFVGHPINRYAWIGMWVITTSLIVGSRFIAPIVRNSRWKLRVASVVQEGTNTYSLTVTGANIDKLAVSGGQFFQWRFLTRGLWWHSHPYSLSALPRPPFMRVTIKGLGDQSHAVAKLKPGTRVFVEGPYGTFTRHARSTNHVTLIAAGVGITPLRALLEDLPKVVDVTVIVRASTPDDMIHRDEMAALVALRGGSFHELIGPRDRVRLDVGSLRKLSPKMASGDVYICGPQAFAENMVKLATRVGVPRNRVHFEAFTF
jgi:predicted ferric reductase